MISLSACVTSAEKIQANQKIGNTIVSALYEYEQKNGQFPEQLEILVPDYLSEIPKTVDGYNFSYGILDSEDKFFVGFRIRVSFEKQPGCSYMPRFDLWEYWPVILVLSGIWLLAKAKPRTA